MAQITAFGVDVIEGTAWPPIAIDIVGLSPSGIGLYDRLLADAKKVGPDEAKLVELVGRERAEPLLGEAIGRQATSSFVTDLHGVRKIPRNFFDLIETELRRFGVAAISPTIPDQSAAPVRVEERDGRITRVSDRDSPLGAVERDFNAWREPILEHVRELLENNFREGTNHGRARDRLVALSKLLPGEIADVKERQFRIGYEIERLDGLIVAYRSGADDMPIFDVAVLEDLDRLRIALKMGVDRLERWSEFRRAATNDPARDGDADRDAVGDALEQLADRMDEREKYFDADLPVTFRFLAEAVRDPRGATKTVVYGAVRSAENLISFLGQKSLGIGRNAVEGVEQHISKAVAALLIVVLG